jgi:4-hydroxybenzoate polyprenyltransferase
VTEPSPRQVLYALVAGGFLFVVAVLVVGAAAAGLVPIWWTIAMAVAVAVVAAWSALRWRRTGPVLAASIGLLLCWVIGTLLLRA